MEILASGNTGHRGSSKVSKFCFYEFLHIEFLCCFLTGGGTGTEQEPTNVSEGFSGFPTPVLLTHIMTSLTDMTYPYMGEFEAYT